MRDTDREGGLVKPRELALVTLGVAIGEVDHHVREEGGENRGPRVRQYLANCDPPINVAAPWCAAFTQYCSDAAAKLLAVPNPLDAVVLEAYVESYREFAEQNGLFVADPLPGDLVIFSFGRKRCDHIGIVLGEKSAAGWFRTIEGNTSPGVGATSAEKEREGDGVFQKLRDASKQPTRFIRWDA